MVCVVEVWIKCVVRWVLDNSNCMCLCVFVWWMHVEVDIPLPTYENLTISSLTPYNVHKMYFPRIFFQENALKVLCTCPKQTEGWFSLKVSQAKHVYIEHFVTNWSNCRNTVTSRYIFIGSYQNNPPPQDNTKIANFQTQLFEFRRKHFGNSFRFKPHLVTRHTATLYTFETAREIQEIHKSTVEHFHRHVTFRLQFSSDKILAQFGRLANAPRPRIHVAATLNQHVTRHKLTHKLQRCLWSCPK